MERESRATLLTLAGSFFFFALIALLLGASTGETATNERALETSTDGDGMICTMNAFFSFDRDDVIGDLVRIGGRGLLTCRNDSGFTLEEPIIADLETKITTALPEGEIAISASSSAFVVTRDLSQLQDLYQSRQFRWTQDPRGNDRRLVFRGVANDLVIEMNLMTAAAPLNGMEFRNLRLHYDDAAPDLNGY